MVCNRSLHLQGNPKLAWHPARLTKGWGYVDISMDTLHLKYPLILFGYEGSALTLPLFLLSPNILMLCHRSSTMTKDHFLIIFYGTKLPLCVDVPLTLIHSFIHSRLPLFFQDDLSRCISQQSTQQYQRKQIFSILITYFFRIITFIWRILYDTPFIFFMAFKLLKSYTQ